MTNEPRCRIASPLSRVRLAPGGQGWLSKAATPSVVIGVRPSRSSASCLVSRSRRDPHAQVRQDRRFGPTPELVWVWRIRSLWAATKVRADDSAPKEKCLREFATESSRTTECFACQVKASTRAEAFTLPPGPGTTTAIQSPG